MRRQMPWVTVIVLLLALLAAPGGEAQQQNKFRLKPGADGKLCLGCHSDFEQKLKSRFVHTPVKAGECTGCHSPHASDHGKLLAASPSAVCATCHQDLVPAKAVSTHKVVVEGNCVKCHDPHASGTKGNLLKAGNELCLTCHKTVGDTIAKAKFKHIPVADGCLNCHNPHASEKAAHLLVRRVPELCIGCHKPDSQRFVSQHASYPVARADCASCHDPHGSNTAGILFDTVHAPVAGRRCNQCHGPATAAEPFATRRPGFELCRGCHGTMMNETFSKSRVHWPLVGKTGCLSCHEAHASRKKKLLNVEEAALCAQCHTDTVDWQTRLAEKERQANAAPSTRAIKGAFTHQPVQSGACSSCHVPHSSDSAHLMGQASVIETCGTCHDWLKHSSHPLGEKSIDMRNKNLSVDCLSCHRSHGTGHRHMLTFPTSSELCVQCHKPFRR